MSSTTLNPDAEVYVPRGPSETAAPATAAALTDGSVLRNKKTRRGSRAGTQAARRKQAARRRQAAREALNPYAEEYTPHKTLPKDIIHPTEPARAQAARESLNPYAEEYTPHKTLPKDIIRPAEPAPSAPTLQTVFKPFPASRSIRNNLRELEPRITAIENTVAGWRNERLKKPFSKTKELLMIPKLNTPIPRSRVSRKRRTRRSY